MRHRYSRPVARIQRRCAETGNQASTVPAPPTLRKVSLTRSVLVIADAQFTAENGLVKVYLTIPDLEVESAIRIRTHPRLVANRRTLASEVRQRNEIALVTLQALREWRVLQGNPPPAPNLRKLYLSPIPLANRNGSAACLACDGDAKREQREATVDGTVRRQLAFHETGGRRLEGERANDGVDARAVPRTLRGAADASGRTRARVRCGVKGRLSAG